MLVGAAAGVVAGVAALAFLTVSVPAQAAIALVLAVPTVLGLALVLFVGRRWATAAGAVLLAFGPAWFAVLIAAQVVADV